MLLIMEGAVYAIFSWAWKLVRVAPRHVNALKFGLLCQPVKHNMQRQRLSIRPQPHKNRRDSSQVQVSSLTRLQLKHRLAHRHQLANLATYDIIHNLVLLHRPSDLISIFLNVPQILLATTSSTIKLPVLQKQFLIESIGNLGYQLIFFIMLIVYVLIAVHLLVEDWVLQVVY
jgi:hypothetical protein